MLTVIDGKLMNTRDVGNAVATLLLGGMTIDKICEIEGMPTPTQIAYMRRSDAAFADAMTVAFEGAGIESAFVLASGARTGNIGKNQLEAAKWVAERLAPELFQERKTITNTEIKLTDEELAFQLQAAARSDDRVRRILQERGDLLGELVVESPGDKKENRMATGYGDEDGGETDGPTPEQRELNKKRAGKVYKQLSRRIR